MYKNIIFKLWLGSWTKNDLYGRKWYNRLRSKVFKAMLGKNHWVNKAPKPILAKAKIVLPK